ncbi:5-formyltetrahydrofolate cyclo-ligase [Sulfitobacter sp. R18_1]|uniref:5-formyltetrahydrofolate cyclo-ligase n=1 Tax=Sulfitobacter sp. R18_1 TaxID=2821104 RepID=UPI001ADBBDB6|nr:5-formyltetrahydrofolate cyclo-ligase [Sulfitobacter sp. R18_1]MBO9432112.1 5-formyltetrahydrofolate cyclo-ligase [Sulfitobacter sp. R18_1]
MEDDNTGGSDPCMAHLLIGGSPVDPIRKRDVARFRTAERARLLQARQQLSVQERAAMTANLIATLETLITPQPDMKIAVYWPIRGELDLRAWITKAHAAGALVLLPVVTRKDAPLSFRTWQPGCAMERGLWNIPVPMSGVEAVPDIVISPLLGVDETCYRLGNGGGYYDRTLAQLDPPPKVIGVGFSHCRMPTIFPMPWDIPMDTAVLSDGSVLAHTATIG